MCRCARQTRAGTSTAARHSCTSLRTATPRETENKDKNAPPPAHVSEAPPMPCQCRRDVPIYVPIHRGRETLNAKARATLGNIAPAAYAKKKGAGSVGQHWAGCVPGPPAPGTKLLPRWTYVVFPPGEATGKTLRCCALVMGDPSSAAPTCQPKPHSTRAPRPCQRLGRSRAAELRVGCLHGTQGRASK